MEEDNCAQTALDVMADLLKERGYDYSYAQELEGSSLFYIDKAGNYHDCWGAGSSELVNVPIAVTPEQALSVDDLNGIIDENATLERGIDELCIENQRLLEEVMSLEAALEGMHIINDRYRADHARLTEFAEDAYSFAYNCYHGVCEQETFLRLRAKRNELRELGIEVPDGS